MSTEVLHKDGAWFAPWLDVVPGGRVVVWFHEDDISDEGAAVLADVFTEQLRSWRPRDPGEARGPLIPVTMAREPDMPEGIPIVIDDSPDHVHYTARADLISKRGAVLFARMLTSKTPDWERTSATYRVQLRAV